MSKAIRWPVCGLLAGLLLFPVGCGKRTIYPMSGVVVDEEGKPIAELKGADVVFEAKSAPVSAVGTLDAEGRFVLTTETKNDGAHLGEHRILIAPFYPGADKPAPYPILPKYKAFESSELTAVVEPKENVIELKVERVKEKR